MDISELGYRSLPVEMEISNITVCVKALPEVEAKSKAMCNMNGRRGITLK